MQTTIPAVDRTTIFEGTQQISGTLGTEAVGTLVYVYFNAKRVATVFTFADTNNQRRWTTPLTAFAFGGGQQKVKLGDKFYFVAKAVGKDKSGPSIIYTVSGIDQPSPPYVQTDPSQAPAQIYERERYLAGDVPLLNEVTPFNPDLGINVPEGVAVSIYVNGTFLGTAQSDRIGHWTFDTWSVQDSPLLPLEKTDVVTARATRYSVDPNTGAKMEILAPSAESVGAEVLSGFYQNRLFDFLPVQMKDDDATTGDLQSFIKVLALTLDEVKTYVDQFTDIFDIDRCDPKYFDALAYLLGYPLNRLDSVQSQRFQIKNAVELWRRKGTFEVFKILFYLLEYNLTIVELWTDNYQTFYPTVMDANYVHPIYTDGHGNPVPPPDNSSYLLENGGAWYKSPYFGLVIQPFTEYGPTPTYPYQTDPVACPVESSTQKIAFSPEDLKYLIERIDYFRPAHTVMDYIEFTFPIVECGPIPEDPWELDVSWQPQEPGWYLPYCDPDDPIYYRDSLRSTRADGKGLLALGVTRDPAGLHPSTDPTINMKRLPGRGYCHPGEDLEFIESSIEEENYYYYMRRDGMGLGGYPIGEPIGTPDINDWPSRNSFYPPTRDQTYRYASRLVIRKEIYIGA